MYTYISLVKVVMVKTPDCGITTQNTRLWNNNTKHQIVEKQHKTPDCGITTQNTRLCNNSTKDQIVE